LQEEPASAYHHALDKTLPSERRARVIGIGGVFFRSGDPDKLYAWYERHLGLKRSQGVVLFPWKQSGEEARERMTVWSLFPKDTEYFGPANPAFMVNYIVDDLDGMVTDPEGNRIELWQPPNRPV
jgi:hypothetical protein